MLIDMRDETVLVFGGGKVGFRKTRDLLQSECRIIAVSETFLDDFFQLDPNRIRFHRCSAKEFFQNEEGVLENIGYAIVAMNDEEENEKTSLELQKRRIRVLRVDNREGSDFIMPAVLQRDEICIAVSTGGKNPLVAKELKREIDSLLSSLDLQKLKVMEEVRAHLIKVPEGKREFEIETVMKKLIGSDIREAKKYLGYLKEKKG